MDTKIFLITCVKDGKDLIWPLFDSLIKQSSHNFIHYIYDDGSKDTVEDLVDKYKKEVESLPQPHQIIYEKNSVNIGLNMSTINAIKKCNLPYFTWINCDDKVDINFIKEIEKNIKKHKRADVFRSNQIAINSEGQQLKLKEFSRLKYAKSKNQMNQFLYRYYFWSTFVVKTDSYKQVNPNFFFDQNPQVFNDRQVLFVLLNKKGTKFIFCKKAISYYLVREASEGHKYNEMLESDFYNKNSLYYGKIINELFPENLSFYQNHDKYRDLYKAFFSDYKKRNFKNMCSARKIKNQFAKKNKLPKNLLNFQHDDFYYLIRCLFKKYLSFPINLRF